MKVIKRDGTVVDYDRTKIAIALHKANDAVEPEERVSEEQVDAI
ncbi:MAG: ATP cone domain-containing protein, partial [Oscillospiraceae bacterium]|nr:ATP cone domain-containing protein [Oscillospiraceae bacterium]